MIEAHTDPEKYPLEFIGLQQVPFLVLILAALMPKKDLN
jgi:hypothetical protein